jgi:hypothetical protein
MKKNVINLQFKAMREEHLGYRNLLRLTEWPHDLYVHSRLTKSRLKVIVRHFVTSFVFQELSVKGYSNVAQTYNTRKSGP